MRRFDLDKRRGCWNAPSLWPPCAPTTVTIPVMKRNMAPGAAGAGNTGAVLSVEIGLERANNWRRPEQTQELIWRIARVIALRPPV